MFERIIAQDDISINNNSLLQNNQTEVSIHNKNTIVQLLANHLETKLNKSAIILKIVSDIPQIRTLPNASLINPSFHGIPKDTEIQKRQLFLQLMIRLMVVVKCICMLVIKVYLIQMDSLLALYMC